MTCSTSSFNNLVRCALVLLVGVMLGGCALFQGQPEPTATLPPPVSETPSPQVVDTIPVLWKLDVSVPAEQGYHFEWIHGDDPVRQSDLLSEPRWQFTPQGTGLYRVRVRLYDSDGSYRLSEWSEPFKIVAPPRITSLVADRPDPQAAKSVPISWRTRTSDGVPPYNYQFELLAEQQQRFVQQGPSPDWQWRPDEAGSYKVRVTVTDIRGNRQQSDWSDSYRIMEPLAVTQPKPTKDAQHYPLGTRIDWIVKATGGVGDKTFRFEVEKKGEEARTARTTDNNIWNWQPTDPGFYRIRALVIDKLGNRQQGEWSEWREVRAPLTVSNLQADISSPIAALSQPVYWHAETNGGVGQLSYDFILRHGNVEQLAQQGKAASWRWLPRAAGNYQVKVRVRDELGKTAESDWSAPYQIEIPLQENALIALLPLENLSGSKVPAEQIESTYRKELEQLGLRFLSRERLDAFMYRHRMRYTGGISAKLAKALREEEQVTAVVITTLMSYSDSRVPQVAISSRLVLCQNQPQIAWIDVVGLTGEDAPGLLALNRVTQVEVLLDRATQQMIASLDRYLQSERPAKNWKKDHLPPNDFYRASELNAAEPYKVALVPFLNRYARRNAGFIVPLQLAADLHRQDNLEVFEPGLIREQLLKYRLIMRAGPSLAISDVLSSATTLDADLILSGQVFDFQDDVGNPKIDFSTRLFDGKQRQIVWWSRSYANGNDGVYFYDFGRIRSAQVLLERMSTSISMLLFPPQTSRSAL